MQIYVVHIENLYEMQDVMQHQDYEQLLSGIINPFDDHACLAEPYLCLLTS